MDINIQEVHYQKYIKYKKKYLELKQSGGSGMMSIFGKSKVQPNQPNQHNQPNQPNFDILNGKQHETEVYGVDALRLLEQFFVNLENWKSSLNDITNMRNDLIIILNKIIIKNNNLKYFSAIIGHINNCYNSIDYNKTLYKNNSDKNQKDYESKYKHQIYVLLDMNKEISPFISLKIAINTYLYYIFNYILGDYTRHEIQSY
jgi:hypothetical protein